MRGFGFKDPHTNWKLNLSLKFRLIDWKSHESNHRYQEITVEL